MLSAVRSPTTCLLRTSLVSRLFSRRFVLEFRRFVLELITFLLLSLHLVGTSGSLHFQERGYSLCTLCLQVFSNKKILSKLDVIKVWTFSAPE